jgi:hypothetical protein
MTLALNRPCTIGTLDGANVEMLKEVGNANISFLGRWNKKSPLRKIDGILFSLEIVSRRILNANMTRLCFRQPLCLDW